VNVIFLYLKLIGYLLARIDLRLATPKIFFLNQTTHTIEFLKREIKRNGRNYNAMLMLAGIYRSEKKFQESAGIYRQLIAQGKEGVKVIYGLSMCLFFIEDYNEAEYYFNKLLKIKPDNKIALDHLGRICLIYEKHNQAIEFFSKSIEQKKDDPQVLENIAYCYFYTGQFDKALQAYSEAYKLKPSKEIEENIRGLSEKMRTI